MPLHNHNQAFDDAGSVVQCVQFPFDEIADRLDGAQTIDREEADEQRLGKFLLWLSTPKAEAYFGRGFTLRLLAFSWVTDPAAHSGKSLSQLAREHGVKVQQLSRYCADASRVFGIRNRSQRAHGKRWRNRTPSTVRLKVSP